MNPNRGSYSQKKKKEAVRRLSHGGPRGGKGKRQANPADSRAFVRGRRARRSHDSLEEDDHSSSRGLFSGRTVFATDSPTSGTNLVIQRTVEGLSQGSDSPDLEHTSPRRIVTSADNSSRSTTTSSLFGNSTAVVSNTGLVNYSGAASSSSALKPSDDTAKPESRNPFRGVSPPKSLFVFNPFEGQTHEVPSTGSTTSGISESLFKSKEAVPGRESVTRNLFGKAPKTSDTGQSTSAKPVTTLADQTTAKVGFRREGPALGNAPLEASAAMGAEQKLPSRTIFGKVNDPSGQREATAKRQLSPSRAEAARKRTLTTFDDPFTSSSQRDITDLETFGTSKKEPKPKKPALIKRAGLFGKAIAEASRIDRDPRSRTKSRSPERGQRHRSDEGKRHSSVERKQHSPDMQTEKVRKKHQDENKPAGSICTSTPSSQRQYAKPEEINKLTSILVKGVPPSENTKEFLRMFFSKYGEVKRVYTQPMKNAASITFLDHVAAANAKKVRTLKPGCRVTISWKPGQQGTRSENRQSVDDKPSPSVGKRSKPDVPRPSLGSFTSPLVKVTPEDGPSTMRPSTSQDPVSNQQKQIPAVSRHLLSKTVGQTAQERYDILEDRDKIIRQGLKKQSNLVTARAIKGTCPDMCPEKERYMRVVQRRLHPFETERGTTDKVNHDTAVKEYSRSSADQEEPLPHEMRPAPVLTMTMNYLMRHIMNNGRDGHWEEWFDFLWSRTRGIRKDITQQDLCDLTAIDLMEKCARFHIFCSHRLCEEDRNTIDPKINNENLTKCMQSLKQFYHDLAGEGVICPNEAEFRAYDILLNLNDRDILRQAQQYRADVKNSESVRFALKAFSAISSNNYVKFFKLVRSATYLNACIMHRYFMQVRNLALDVMIKAYTFSSTRGSNFPLVNIATSLAFDDTTQASEFCQSHNLTVEEGVVTFSRSAFQHPDITPVAERSHSIIEAKNSMSIGEVVNGGPLPLEVVHHPMSSFDENGNYKGYTVATKATPAPTNEQQALIPEKDQRVSGNTFKPIENQMPIAPSTAVREVKETTVKTPYSNVEIKEAAREIFLEVINEMAQELGNSFVCWIHLIRKGSSDILDEVYEGASTPMVAKIAEEVMQEQRVQEQRVQEEKQRHHEAQVAKTRRRILEQEQQEQQALMERIAQGVREDTLETVVKAEAVAIATDEISDIQRQLKLKSIERCVTRISQELIQEVLAEESQRVSTEVIQVETALRDQRLAEIEKAVLLGQQAKYLQRWYRAYKKRFHLNFPAAPSNHTAQEQLRVLWAGHRETKEVTGEGVARERAGVTLESPYGIEAGREKIANSIRRIHYLQNLRRQKAWSSLDLPAVLCDSFRSHHAPLTGGSCHGNRQQHHYWKLVASLPASGAHEQEGLCDWLKAKLRRGKLSEGARRGQLGDDDEVETLSLYSARVPHVSSNKLCTLSICTKVTMGSLGSTTSSQHSKRNQLLGTSGILFALDPPSSNPNFWLQAKSRLDSILQGKPVTPPLPLVIALLDWSAIEHAQSMCTEKLALNRLAEKGFVSSYHFLEVTKDVESPQNSQELSESLDWLATRCPRPPSLSEDTLKGYLDTGLAAFFSLSLYEDAKTRRDACLPEQDCCHVIDLYNATVRHLADVASSGFLSSLSWPPAEFTKSDNQSELPSPDWNCKQHLDLLRTKILSLLLPGLPLISEDDDWQSVCDFCHQYLVSLPGSSKSKLSLLARVQRILEKCRRSFEDTCYFTYDAPGCEPLAGHVPWSRIIEECVNYMMSTVQTRQDTDDDEEGNELTVFYIQSEFDAFEVPHTWRDAVNTTNEESFIQPPRFVSQVASDVQQKQAEFIEKIHEATLIEMQNEETSFNVLESEPALDVAARNSATAVKTLLSSAKKESKKFDALLQQWLHGTEGAPLQNGASLHDGAKGSPRDTKKKTSPSFGSSPPVEQSLDDLRMSIESEKRADRLAELRLANLLNL